MGRVHGRVCVRPFYLTAFQKRRPINYRSFSFTTPYQAAHHVPQPEHGKAISPFPCSPPCPHDRLLPVYRAALPFSIFHRPSQESYLRVPITSCIRKNASLPPVPVVRTGVGADVATCGALPVVPRHQDSIVRMPVSLPPKKPVGSLYDAKVNLPPHSPPSAFGRTKETG